MEDERGERVTVVMKLHYSKTRNARRGMVCGSAASGLSVERAGVGCCPRKVGRGVADGRAWTVGSWRPRVQGHGARGLRRRVGRGGLGPRAWLPGGARLGEKGEREEKARVAAARSAGEQGAANGPNGL
jgi:hypothetical protein